MVEDWEANLQKQLIEWKDIFSRDGLRVRLVKTEVMWDLGRAVNTLGWEEA